MSAETTISDKTKITLPQVVGIVLAVVSFFGYQYAQFDSVKERFHPIENRLSRIEEILTDRVTRTEFSQWVELVRAKNPTLMLPEVRR